MRRRSLARILLQLVVWVLLGVAPAANSAFAWDRPSAKISELVQAPVIDGNVSREEWAGATVIDGPLIQIRPNYGRPSSFSTIIRIGRTESALYVLIDAHDPEPSRLAAAVTARDGEIDDDDAVGVTLDTQFDGRTAYAFATNPLATQWDARVADNGRTVNPLWDAAWNCAASRLDDRWVAEFEIPFSILRFSLGSDRTWGLSFWRTVPRRLETSLWSAPTEDSWRVSSFGTLTGLELRRRDEKAWQAIPYVIGVATEDKDQDFEIGADLRWKPSSSVGVDLTLNPDFALIEADVEEINLSRFELFIPEKRPFFLEGHEMFSQRMRQFYSRRIGEITWGAKAIGTLGQTDFTVIATSENRESADLPGSTDADYSIARFQRALPGGSTVGLLAGNRSKEGVDQGSTGLDATLFFSETLGLTAQFSRVHGPTADGGLAWFIRPAYDSATTHFHVRYSNLDRGIREDFNATGFLRDDDRKEFDTNLEHTFWIADGPVEKVEAEANYNRYSSQDDVLRSWELETKLEVVFRSHWEIELDYVDEFQLFEKEFRNERTVVRAGWDARDGRSIFARVGSGENFDNDLTLYGAQLAWPFRDSMRLEYSVTGLVLAPDPESETTWIHVLEGIYSFNPDLFIKLFGQSNTATDKVNIQATLVWRYKPPFGALQVAFQRGTSDVGEVSEQGNTLFVKSSWVF